ncbi:hypothetical protein [Microcoleus asticus]|uniref:hypothetical protein n=1 Tax=Microcoleus asticus TaxID=2815231 RepID=UPI001551FAB2|nr:hypothetical protein [Microcoleus asticus]
MRFEIDSTDESGSLNLSLKFFARHHSCLLASIRFSAKSLQVALFDRTATQQFEILD